MNQDQIISIKFFVITLLFVTIIAIGNFIEMAIATIIFIFYCCEISGTYREHERKVINNE